MNACERHVGRLSDFPALLDERFGASQRVIFTDESVHALYHDLLEGFRPTVVEVVPSGEGSKCFETVVSACNRLAAGSVERSAVFVAFGGGVVGDLGGFIASIWMRGVSLVQIPTTLVAMVDSSLGGKVGINLPRAKNLVGSFHQAAMNLCDPRLLRSLPAKEFANGMAEALKHALIDSHDHWDWCRGLEANPAEWSEELLEQLVVRSSSVKAAIVEEDPLERSVRAHLNLGHTLGHALEAVSGGMEGHGLSHGQAVAIGLVASLKLSDKLGRLRRPQLIGEMREALTRWGLPTAIDPELAWSAVEAAMRSDKKVKDGRLRFVLASEPGEVAVVGDVPPEAVREVFEELQCEH